MSSQITRPAYVAVIQKAQARGYRLDLDEGLVYNPRGWRLRPNTTSEAYPWIALRVEGKAYRVSLHRWAAWNLWGDAIFAQGVVVRHLNNDKTDFRKSNLALGSQRDNVMDVPARLRRKRSRAGVRNRAPNWADPLRVPKERTLSPDQIREMIALCPWVRGRVRHGYVKEMSQRYGVSRTLISLTLRGKKCRLDYPEFQGEPTECQT